MCKTPIRAFHESPLSFTNFNSLMLLHLFLADAKEFCAYEEYENATLTHVDAFYSKKTKEECEKLCEEATAYHCRGYSVVIVSRNNRLGNCFLHSEDTKVHGPKLLTSNYLGRYYEKARCLNGTTQITHYIFTGASQQLFAIDKTHTIAINLSTFHIMYKKFDYN